MSTKTTSKESAEAPMLAVDDLISQLRQGSLDPETALRKFEINATHISEIKPSTLKVDIIHSGFPSMDDFLFLKRDRSELIVFGARPGMGKSAFMCQLAAQVARKENVLVYSLEMDKESIYTRLISVESGKRISLLQNGSIPKAEIDKYAAKLSALKLYIDDRPRQSVGSICNSAESFHKSLPLSLVVIDYLQLIKTAEKGTRDAEIGNITAELKGLSKRLNCPIIVGSQLNRACEQRGYHTGDYSPQLSDLRESGNIEQDSDQVIFLSRPSVYEDERHGEADIFVAKNRNGKTGKVLMRFSQEQCKFYDDGLDNL